MPKGLKRLERREQYETNPEHTSLKDNREKRDYCDNCHALFQSDEVVKEIENQLFLIDTKKLG